MLDVSNEFTSTVYSVGDLNAYIRALLESNENLMDIWVSGELSNLSRPRSGHIYFSLKDKTASVRCVIWRAHAMRLSGALRDGLLIEAHGNVSVYEEGGQYQLYVDGIRAAGEGRLFLEFLKLKEKLTEEGLFDEERKRPLPRQPNLIGIVTSPTGAALQDMLNTLRIRYPLAEVVLSPASVQGASAPGEIVTALEKLNQYIQPDVILVGRGGGSLEDLWAFNDELVVRAVAGSQAPVISGVGHETDFTLTDFVADVRAPTPTGAAVAAVPEISELEAALQNWGQLLLQGIRGLIDANGVHLQNTMHILNRLSPDWQIKQSMQQLDNLSMRLDHITRAYFNQQEQKLIFMEEKIAVLDPHQILGRGYALVEDEDGNLVSSVKHVRLDQNIQVNVSDGIISADVTETHEKE